MTTQLKVVAFNIGDLGGIVTLGSGGGNNQPVPYKLVGRNTKDAFTNKTITDPSNRVAASLLTVGGTSAPINGAASIGEVLTVTSTGYEFQPVGGTGPAVSLATAGAPVAVDSSPAPTGEGFVLSTTGATDAEWTLQPVNNIRITTFGTPPGNTATAGFAGSIAIGDGATADIFRSISIGNVSQSASAATAVGAQADASGFESSAFGQGSQATDDRATAIGRAAQAQGTDSVALGETARAQQAGTVAIGAGALATIAGTCVINATNFVFGANDTGGTALGNYADDVAAAAGGVPLGGEYHNNGLRRVRIA